MLISPETFSRQFRGLTATKQRQFVASVWRARGYEAAVEDRVIIARRNGDERVLRLVGGWPLRNYEADVWIGRRDTSWARARARDTDAEYVSPSELHSRFLYGIDRTMADRIARCYFGVGLAGLEARWTRQLVTVVSFIALALVIVAVGVTGLPVPGGPAGTDMADVGTDETPLQSINATDMDVAVSYPPGLSSEGVTDSARLVEAHKSQVSGLARVVKFTYFGIPSDALKPSVIRQEATLRMHSPATYRYTVTETTVDTDGTRRNARQTIFRNGTVPGIHNRLRFDERVYKFSHPVPHGGWPDQPPEIMRESVVTVYSLAMSAEETKTDDVVVLGSRLYRVTATGRPPLLANETDSFEATAYITTEGRLVHLTVSYRHATIGTPIAIQVSYEQVGSVQRSEFAMSTWTNTSIRTRDDPTGER